MPIILKNPITLIAERSMCMNIYASITNHFVGSWRRKRILIKKKYILGHSSWDRIKINLSGFHTICTHHTMFSFYFLCKNKYLRFSLWLNIFVEIGVGCGVIGRGGEGV